MGSGYKDEGGKRYEKYEKGQIDGIIIEDENGNTVRKIDSDGLTGVGRSAISNIPFASFQFDGVEDLFQLQLAGLPKTGSSDENLTQVPLADLAITGIYVFTTQNTLDGDAVVTVRKNGSDTPLSVTVPAGQNGVLRDIDDEVEFDEDLLSVFIDMSDSSSGDSYIAVTLRCEGL